MTRTVPSHAAACLLLVAGCPADEKPGAKPSATPAATPASAAAAPSVTASTASTHSTASSAPSTSTENEARPPPLPPPEPVSKAVLAGRMALLKGVPRCDERPTGTRGSMRPQVDGASRAAVRKKLGAPHCHEGPDEWVYWFPEGCTSDRDVVTVSFRGDTVARVTSVSVVTGLWCDHDF